MSQDRPEIDVKTQILIPLSQVSEDDFSHRFARRFSHFGDGFRLNIISEPIHLYYVRNKDSHSLIRFMKSIGPIVFAKLSSETDPPSLILIEEIPERYLSAAFKLTQSVQRKVNARSVGTVPPYGNFGPSARQLS